MDTKFWGPSAWKLFHLVTFEYKYSPTNAIMYANFFETIPFILPCKFCRSSITDFYRRHPFRVHDRLDLDLDLKRWMYTIHNCVNDKLRRLGLNPARTDPKYSDIKKFYEKWQLCDWQQHLSVFWNFLFAVAHNHPKDIIKHTTPIPECPAEVYKCNDVCEKNKWNVLSLSDRLYWFRRFWAFLPAVLPEEIAKRWEDVEKKNPPTLECRRSSLAWLWRMRCGLDPMFRDPYTSMCKVLTTFSSDCGGKRCGTACRKRRFNKTVKK